MKRLQCGRICMAQFHFLLFMIEKAAQIATQNTEQKPNMTSTSMKQKNCGSFKGDTATAIIIIISNRIH